MDTGTNMGTGTSQFAEKAKDVRKDLRDLGSLTVDAVKEKASELKDGAADIYAQGCEKAKDIQNEATNYIKKEPIKALLIAGTAGFMLGWLLTRQSK